MDLAFSRVASAMATTRTVSVRVISEKKVCGQDKKSKSNFLFIKLHGG